jgi:Rps23 Pro-64 3,4-dihydroxylase Tpa1-like proline 4-hydroxylase
MGEARRVRVDLLLTGGQRQALELAEDSPLLRELLDALVARLAPGPPRIVLFQVPIDDGRGALTFPSDQLVALVTTPPVLAGTEDVVVTAEALSDRIPARYVRIDGVLGAAGYARLLEAAIARESELEPSRVTTNAAGYRRSRLVHRPGELAADLVALVRARLPELCARLDVRPFPVGEIEAQLTVHNEGDYFRVHSDNGDAETRSREISYVYYFHRLPKQFAGGELTLFDARVDGGGQLVVDGPPITIEPESDSLVVFPSACLHEVRPVRMLGDDWRDGRFTINGWVRRADAVAG